MSCKNTYFLIYNIACWVAWTYLAFQCFIRLPPKIVFQIDKASQQDFEYLFNFYEGTIGILATIQLCQLVEILHSFLGIVRSNPLMGIMQIGGRLHCIFIAMLFWKWESSVNKNEWVTKYLFVGYYGATIMWTIAELIRYPFYIVKTLKLDNENILMKIINWLRYSAFIILYPVGISGEIRCYYGVIQWFTQNINDKKKIDPWCWKVAMVEEWNVVISIKTYLIVMICIVIMGGMALYQHMMKQRRKVLKVKAKEKTR